MISLSITDDTGALRAVFDQIAARALERVARLTRGFMLRRDAADGENAALAADSVRAETVPQTPAAANAPGRDYTAHARFQRDIVPELDAAYNFARFLSRDADAAHDIVQDAFLRAYRGFTGYQGGDVRAWIFAIVRNCYHDWLIARRRKARLEIDVHGKDDVDSHGIDEVASEDDDPETALLRRVEANAVREALNRLPRPLREILILRELEGLSYRQIADVAMLPIGTVMSRLARARTQFAGIWREDPRRQETTP